jgi:GTP cyclohydrolase I
MKYNKADLPDTMSDVSSAYSEKLNWVGMEKIAIPLAIPIGENAVSLSAKIDVYVNLEASRKGIHMSRLYSLVQQSLANTVLTSEGLEKLLTDLVSSQHKGSDEARVNIQFDLPIVKSALKSNNQGYQSYPVNITQQLVGGKQSTQLQLTVPYSSTCPCSVSLARNLIAEQINDTFDGETLSKEALLTWLQAKDVALATPHNQRSYAYIDMTIKGNSWPDLRHLIFEIEKAIGTPVQTAVKREDEQAFAKLNGENLLFCEDAARKLTQYLNMVNYISEFSFKVEHQESLHAHNAVVIHSSKASDSG